MRYGETMQLSPQAIQEFKQIYREEYGKEISDDEAREAGTRLVRVFKVICEVETRPDNDPAEPPPNKTTPSA